ncbi:1-acyl-sn-glycerol-3-phosphate acyltransferase [Mycoplasma sp. Pen4]|uniref:lysophospholipid acyltransferase family protein n=1 Tax=Mycoplasma sp. Pen4 TaxID=640330 RepID=UPI001654BE98|nr:lysophospholipid acyltransferase family protein [Mycoplasma sp. Pen4]QNM93702.1 1-acyl-sn-glycerol-3-phosphate acyltransferase [Mycoplasma sp. Pen4]
MAINIKFKKVILSPVWLLRAIKIWWKARKYKKDPAAVDNLVRYDYVLKLAKKILKMYNVDLVIENYENLPKNGNTLIVANHKSNFDPLALLVALEKQTQELSAKEIVPTFVAKQELEENKTIFNAAKLIDTFFIDRKNIRESLKTMTDFSKFVKENKTYGVIFPEGTRHTEEGLGEFKTGAFKVAQKEYFTILPVAIINSINSDNSKRSGRQTITVSFLKPIKPHTFISQEAKSISEHVKSLISNEMSKYGDKN